MIVVLVLIAAGLSLALANSAIGTLSRVTKTDRSERGSWGIVDWHRERSRTLDAQARRWQTALISGRDQSNRWPDVVAEIERLERAADLTVDPSPPREYDRRWIEERLEQLETIDAFHQPEGTP